MGDPLISLVTPVLNRALMLDDTLRSVLAQGYPALEYLVVDGGSSDGTLDTIRRYEDQLAGWISEPDGGMYDAVNKGFARSSGSIMGWISATDLLHVGSLRAVATIFESFPEVEWITGRPTLFSQEGHVVSVEPLKRWSRWRFLVANGRYIQQESTFWRRSLWERAGGRVDDSTRNGGDFELWARFFRHARLHSVDTILGGYRNHDDALSIRASEENHGYHDGVVARELALLGRRGQVLGVYKRLDGWVRATPRSRWLRKLTRKPARVVQRLRGPDLAPSIAYSYNRKGWALSSKRRSLLGVRKGAGDWHVES